MDERLKLLSRAITEFIWDYDAEQRLDKLGLTKPYCERVVRRCIDAQVDLKTLSSGSMTVFYRDHDVTIDVVFVDPRRPAIVGLHKAISKPSLHGSKKATSKRKGTTYPKTVGELRERIKARGYDISNDAHAKVTKDGKTVLTLPGTPGDRRSLRNAWSDFKLADKRGKGGK